MVGSRFGYLYQGETIGDLNRANVAAAQPRLAGYRTDQILRPNTGATPEAEEQTRHAAG